MYMVSRGETSIESHDNDYLERKAKEEGLVSVLCRLGKPYVSVGIRWKRLTGDIPQPIRSGEAAEPRVLLQYWA